MDMKNPRGFVEYCQLREGDQQLDAAIQFANKWADLSVRLSSRYGGSEQGMDVFVGEAFERMSPVVEGLDTVKLKQARDILTQFWEHGEAFDTWFQSRLAEMTSEIS